MNKMLFVNKILKSGSKGIIFLAGIIVGGLIVASTCNCDLVKILNSDNLNIDNFLNENSEKNISDFKDNKNSKSNIFEVERVIDGDTIVIEGGEKVRFIGIDTPERGEFYYKEATDYMKSLVENKKVRLEKDVSERDRYGRLLRHVYVDDIWINAKMIKEGYARFVTFPPDVSHVEKFRKLEKEAKENKKGLWSDKKNN